MKHLHEFAKTLTDALAAVEGAKAAEERARLAQQVASTGLANAEKARIAAHKTKAEADAYVQNQKAYAEKFGAEELAKLKVEKAQHDRWIENAKGQVNIASETLTALQKEIAEARLVRDNLNTENAKMLAAFGESAKKLHHG